MRLGAKGHGSPVIRGGSSRLPPKLYTSAPQFADPHCEQSALTRKTGRTRMLSSRKTRHAVRALVVLGGSAAALVALGGIASAHVTITPSTAQQGSKAELWFIVPNEESAASTVELQVKVPVT